MDELEFRPVTWQMQQYRLEEGGEVLAADTNRLISVLFWTGIIVFSCTALLLINAHADREERKNKIFFSN